MNIFTIKSIVITMLFYICSMLCHAQKMKNFFNKELITKVGAICEETSDDNPCAGSEVFLTLIFNKKEVQVNEKLIGTCGIESVNEIGAYKWELLPNKEIKIDFISEQIKNTFEEMFLEFRGEQLLGRITHLNGKAIAYIFQEKTK